jgi:hypothetical protein
MYAAYWQKDKLGLYRISASGVERIGSGAVADLKPIRTLEKRLLIVSSANSFHLRKRYPTISDNDLSKAIRNEIGELFPISNPSFHFRIHEKEKMYMLVDIWAWDGAESERIKEVLKVTYVLPEELAYAADRAEVILYGTNGIAHLAAYTENKFLGSTSLVDSVTLDELTLFIKSLGRYSTELKRLRIYGAECPDLTLAEIEIIREEAGPHPFCLEQIGRINLGEFKLAQERFSPAIDIFLKSAIGISLAYALALFLSIRNYDAFLSQLNQQIDGLSKQSAAAAKVKPGENYSGPLLELEGKLNSGMRPLDAMELLAENLPAKSFLSRLTVNEKNLQASISSKEPLEVIKALSQTKGIKSVKLKGTLIKDGRSGSYNFLLEVGL